MPDLTPKTSFPGPTFEFDFPGVEVGVAEYDEGPTGCTVFHFPAGILASADVRGGSPGTVLASESMFVRAICFAGGSLLGLEAAAGVAAELFDRRGHPEVQWQDVPLVSGAIIFDFGGRKNGVYPDKDLGRSAMRAAQPGVFPLGPRGAGRNAGVGKGPPGVVPEPGGQGAAMRQAGPVKVLALVVLNSMGAIYDRSGRVVRGNLDLTTGERRALLDLVSDTDPGETAPTNTTLTLVVTNQRLTSRDLAQMARQVHASMARCIQPFHTAFDGDVLYAATTNEVDSPHFRSAATLGALASETVWDAVLSAFDPQAGPATRR